MYLNLLIRQIFVNEIELVYFRKPFLYLKLVLGSCFVERFKSSFEWYYSMSNSIIPILTISGSDSINGAGIQADIRTISAMGGVAHTVITTVTAQNSKGITDVFDLPSDIVVGQLRAVLKDMHPKAIKIGMIHQLDAMRALRDELPSCPNVVCAPGILTSRGERLMSDEMIQAYRKNIFPLVKVLVIKCSETELLLGRTIRSQEEMLSAAKALLDMGVKAVMLRGGHCTKNLLTGLLLDSEDMTSPQFFNSPNMEGWQIHGIGGTLSSAIATRLAMGDDIQSAIQAAHKYIRCQVVYSVESTNQSIHQIELYNKFMELIAAKYKGNRDTAFYASCLNVTPRYLAVVTARVAGKNPKQLIADYLMQEIERTLLSSSKSIQEVSIEYGFSTQVAFTKFFKSNKGCSPTEFRNG